MSGRAEHVTPAVQVHPMAIAQAINQVREVMDATDYHSDVVASSYLPAATSLPEQAYAWMMAALLIADMTEVDSMSLRALQTRIYKGSQNVLW